MLAIALTCHAQSIPLILQPGAWPNAPAPSSYPSGTPSTFGVPVPDAWGITCGGVACVVGNTPDKLEVCTTSDCSSGRVNSQMYVETRWPSGNAQFIKLDVQSQGTVNSTTPDTSMFLVNVASCAGGCNFPASANLATSGNDCSGALAGHICINNTGGATACGSNGATCWNIQSANFDLFHGLTIGTTTVIDKARTIGNDGLILVGPATPASSPVGACSGSTAGAQPGGSTFTAGLESGCATNYLSNLDSNSTCSIEENGPLRATVKCTGSLAKSATAGTDNGTGPAANTYMHYTVRLFFYKSQNAVRAQVTLRNADFPTTWPSVGSTDPNAAYKQYASFTAQTTLALAGSGTRTVTIGGCQLAGVGGCTSALTANTTATLTQGTSDNAYIYQAFSNLYEQGAYWNTSNCTSNVSDGCVVSPIHRGTPPADTNYSQSGYKLAKNGSEVAQSGCGGTPCTNGTVFNIYPMGWADIADSGNVGVEIGTEQFAAMWPKELKYVNDGKTVQVGISPLQSDYLTGGDQAYVIEWPAYKTTDILFNFHTSALSSPSDSFLRFQNFLLGRATRTAYNAAVENGGLGLTAILNPLIDPYFEDKYYKTLGMPNACIPSSTLAGQCMRDTSNPPQTNAEPFNVYRFYQWNDSGTNQQDFGLTDLRAWLSRGCSLDTNGQCTVTPGILGSVPGRFMRSRYFYYYFLADQDMPHSDWTGGWRCQTTGTAINNDNCPALTTPPCGSAATSNGTTTCANLTQWGWINLSSIANGGQRGFPDNANSDAHNHTYGMFEYYLISGEEHLKDQLQQAFKDEFLNTTIRYNNPLVSSGTPAKGCGILPGRAIGHFMKGHAREGWFLRGIDDAERDTAGTAIGLQGADEAFQYCLSADGPVPGAGEGESEPAACTSPYLNPNCIAGIAKNRGNYVETGSSDQANFTPWPQNTPQARISSTLFTSIMLSGLYDYWQYSTDLRGHNWYLTSPTGDLSNVTQYTGDLLIQDAMYGISRWATSDPFVNSAGNSAATDWPTSGQMANIFYDHLNNADFTQSCIDHVTCSACSPWGDCGRYCGTVTETNGTKISGCGETDHWANFLGMAAVTNTFNDIAGNSFQKLFDMYQLRNDTNGRQASEWGVDYEQIPLQFIFNHNPPTLTNPTAANNYALAPAALSLQFVTGGVTVSGCTGTGCTFTSTQCNAGSGAGTCTLTWTAPAGRGIVNGIMYRLKYSTCNNSGGACTPRNIVASLFYHGQCLVGSATTDCSYPSMTNPALSIGQACVVNTSDSSGCYEVNPATNMAWFAATNVPDQGGLNTTAVGNNATSYTFNTQANVSYTFSLAAYQSALPPPLPVVTTTITQ